MSQIELKKRKRSDYGFLLDYRLRWSDNDMYDHMNNSIYNFLFDSVVNTYLIKHCGLDPPTSSQYGLVVHTETDYFGSIAFPAVAELALGVVKLGRTSVTYEVAVFEQGVDDVRAVGKFIHVYVDRHTGRPAATGMSDSIKRGLERIFSRESTKL